MSKIPTPKVESHIHIDITNRQIVFQDGVKPRGPIYTDLWIPRDKKPGDDIIFCGETRRILSSEESRELGLEIVDHNGQKVECLALGNLMDYWQWDKATGILLRHSGKFQHERLLVSNVSIGSEQTIPFEGMHLLYVTEIVHAPSEWANIITDYKFAHWIDDHTIVCTKIVGATWLKERLGELLGELLGESYL